MKLSVGSWGHEQPAEPVANERLRNRLTQILLEELSRCRMVVSDRQPVARHAIRPTELRV